MRRRGIWNWISVTARRSAMDADGKPEASTHEETTLSGADRIRKIAEAVHKTAVKSLQTSTLRFAWEVEMWNGMRMCCWQDLIRIQCDTGCDLRAFSPVGKLPLTHFPKGDEVLAVNEDGVCIESERCCRV